MPPLDLRKWDAATSDDRAAIARAVAAGLPPGLRFDGLERVSSFDQEREIAFFTDGASRYALVPGGEVTLGYDPDRHPLLATEEEVSLYEEGDFGMPPLAEYLKEALAPRKITRVDPFLIDVTPQGLWELSDVPIPLSAIAERLAADGFRLPTPDELEHALSGGVETLFIWGDHIIEVTEEHCDAPNGFGIFSMSGYPELTDREELRGAEAGVLFCGGVGRIPETLVYSPRRYGLNGEGPAFWRTHFATSLAGSFDETVYRRTLTVGG